MAESEKKKISGSITAEYHLQVEENPESLESKFEIEPAAIENDHVVSDQQGENFDFWACMMAYFSKFKGIDGKSSPERASIVHVLAAALLSFVGILLVSATSYVYLSKTFDSEHGTSVVMLTGAYGASAVLLYDCHQAPLAQPRNIIGSYIVSPFTGVVTRMVGDRIGLPTWSTAAFSVSIAIVVMNLTKTLHPPGGAVALIAVIGGPPIHNMGFGFMATSLGGAIIMLLVALLGNNMVPGRQYPVFWW